MYTFEDVSERGHAYSLRDDQYFFLSRCCPMDQHVFVPALIDSRFFGPSPVLKDLVVRREDVLESFALDRTVKGDIKLVNLRGRSRSAAVMDNAIVSIKGTRLPARMIRDYLEHGRYVIPNQDTSYRQDTSYQQDTPVQTDAHKRILVIVSKRAAAEVPEQLLCEDDTLLHAVDWFLSQYLQSGLPYSIEDAIVAPENKIPRVRI